jgi:hypothetical protein
VGFADNGRGRSAVFGSCVAGAVLHRIDVSNLFKVLLLGGVLLLTLRIIGKENGIRGTDTWQVPVGQVGNLGNRVRLTKGTIRKDGEQVKVTTQKYDGRSGIVEFREVPSSRSWLQVMFWSGHPRLLLTRDCIFEVSGNSNLSDKFVYVDPTIATQLMNSLHGNDSNDDDQPQPIPVGQEFTVTAKRTNTFKFLLWHHPDATVRTTAWVILVTTLFEILRSITFESQASEANECAKLWSWNPLSSIESKNTENPK